MGGRKKIRSYVLDAKWHARCTHDNGDGDGHVNGDGVIKGTAMAMAMAAATATTMATEAAMVMSVAKRWRRQ